MDTTIIKHLAKMHEFEVHISDLTSIVPLTQKLQKPEQIFSKVIIL